MKPTTLPALFSLALIAYLPLARCDSALFSQFIGATTATAKFEGTSSELQSLSFTVCTNFIHGLQTLPATLVGTIAAANLYQEDVDGVCELCQSISQTRVDSCCGVATSSDCFEKFGKGAAATSAAAASKGSAPATASATNTASTAAATGSKTATSAKPNAAARVDRAIPARGIVLGMLGFIGWAL